MGRAKIPSSIGFRGPFVYRETVVFPGTLLMRSGAYRRGGIRESDNRAEARRRALGKTSDTIVRCLKKHGIDATVVSDRAVNQELK